jgi:hypothetical protein
MPLCILGDLNPIHRVLQVLALGRGIVARVQDAAFNRGGLERILVALGVEEACTVVVGVLGESNLVLDDVRIHLCTIVTLSDQHK